MVEHYHTTNPRQMLLNMLSGVEKKLNQSPFLPHRRNKHLTTRRLEKFEWHFICFLPRKSIRMFKIS